MALFDNNPISALTNPVKSGIGSLFEGMTPFGGSIPSGVLAPEQEAKLRNQALFQGLLGTAATYLATPKNLNAGSPLPYLGRAFLGGMGASQDVIDKAIRQQLLAGRSDPFGTLDISKYTPESIKEFQKTGNKDYSLLKEKTEQQKLEFEQFRKGLPTTTPAVTQQVVQPGSYAPMQEEVLPEQVAPNYGVTKQPDVVTEVETQPEKPVSNIEALKRFIIENPTNQYAMSMLPSIELMEKEATKKSQQQAFSRIFPTITNVGPDGQPQETVSFNPVAVKDYIVSSDNPMKAAKEITENISSIKKQNIFGNVSAASMTPFDSLVSLSSDNKAIQERAKYLQKATIDGRITQEDADKEASKLTDLYVKDSEKRDGREVANAFKQTLVDLKTEQGKFQKEVKTNEIKADIGNKVSNLNNVINQVEYIKTHPGRYNGLIADPRIALKVSLSPQQSYDYASAVDTLKSQAFLNQVSQMKGTGALSNAEGDKIQTALANLSINQSKQEFDRSLKVIFDTMDSAKKRSISLGKPYGLTEADFGVASAAPASAPAPSPASTNFKEGAKTKSKSGKPMVFRNGQWEYE
jgi:hypothetical protein